MFGQIVPLLLAIALIMLFPTQARCGSASAQDAIKTVLTNQADAWNRGDLDSFMKGYLQSPKISYVSGGTEVVGYDALRERYVKKYGDKRDTMGTLLFSDLDISKLGKSNALCIGHWRVEREGQPAIGGIFSLVLVKADHSWKIIHDHTSTSETK